MSKITTVLNKNTFFIQLKLSLLVSKFRFKIFKLSRKMTKIAQKKVESRNTMFIYGEKKNGLNSSI